MASAADDRTALPAGASASVSDVTSSLTLPPALSQALREHQKAALHFIWHRLVDEGLMRMAARTFSCTLEQRALLYQEVYGCIVGHSMGLGKTLTALSFLLLLQAQVLLMLLKKQQIQSRRRGREGATCRALRVLVVCPKSTIHHWLNSAAEWMRPELFGRVSLPFYAPSAQPAKKLEALLQAFHTEGGVLLLGYEEYTRLAKTLEQRPVTSDWNGERVWSMLDGVRQRLPLRPKVRLLDSLECADVVVLDEAHRLKHATSKGVQALRRHLRNVQLRVALTGTPLQNHLEEYNVMQSIVTGSDLDSHQFNRYFVAPIQLGQCSDSSFQQFSEMQRCVAALRRYFAATVHHRGPEELERVLPPRKEFVFFFTLSPQQEECYRALLSVCSARAGDAGPGSGALVLHHQASHVCLHPSLAPDLTGWDTRAGPAESRTDGKRSGEDKKEEGKGEDGDLRDVDVGSDTGAYEDEGDAGFVEDLVGCAAGDDPARTPGSVDVSASPKLLFALNLVEHIVTVRREKVVVFSLYLSHLRLVQALLRQRLDPSLHDAPHIFSGGTAEAQRGAITADFQANPRRRVILCSVRAGGVGIDLTAANHCILLDVSWNPADDTQATYRIFRFGQRLPVTVYRLATRGTTEQVVFAYALRKTWLHKKIADVTDPTRQERHAKRSYFVYPCCVPIDDGIGKQDGDEGEGEGQSDARAQLFLAMCERECPEAAAVIRAAPLLRRSLHFLVRRSFLLRDDSAEAIAEMESRFCEAQRRRAAAQMPIAMADDDDSLLGAAQLRPGRHGRGPPSLLDECEPSLVDTARTAANHILWHVVQRQHDTGRLASAADSTAVVREADRGLCALLQTLLRHAPSAATAAAAGIGPAPAFSFQDMQQRPPPPPPPASFSTLAEVILHLYQEGVRHVLAGTLSQSSFAKHRMYLTSRIPRDAMSAASRRPRHSTLTHGVLEDALLFRPFDLLSRVDAVEQTYLFTEMGLVRPLVQQCVFLGLRDCFGRLVAADSASHAEVVDATRSLLKEYLCDWHPRAWRDLDSSDADDESGSDADVAKQTGTLSQAEAAVLRADVLVPHLTHAFERCLGDLWPSGGGFELPPVRMLLDAEESRTARSYRTADTLTRNAGVVPAEEAATALRMVRSPARRSFFTCPRCKQDVLTRSADTNLGCALCHYNAESALRGDPRYHQSMILFQLSFASNLLDTFSTSRSFSTAFTPASCSTVWDALLRLRVGQPLLPFVERCTMDGMGLILSEFPSKYVQLLALQSGAGDDRELLLRMLHANAFSVWDECLRKHVREGLAACFRDLVEPCAVASFASMPLMAVIVSLHLAARHEHVHFAAELLEDNASNVSAASPTGGRRRAMLHFACDGLVKLLYVEKLLAHCREPPPKPTAAAAEAAGQEQSEGQGGFSDLDNFSLPSHSASRSPQRSLERGDRLGGADQTPQASLRGLIRQPSPTSSDSSESFPGGARRRPPTKRTRHERSEHSSPKPPERHPSRFRSPSPLASSSSSWHLDTDSGASSSSFGSRYASDSESTREGGGHRDGNTAAARVIDANEGNDDLAEREQEEQEEERGEAADQLEDERTLEQRSAQYWVAFCEVYGTRTVETLTVFVEDEELGMTILPPPPPLFWVSQLTKASKDGRTVVQVIDLFVEKLLHLSQMARLVADT